jgi:predicted nucleotidyltransferase
MVYTVEQLKQKIVPIAVKYNLPAVYLFGSYARGEATDDSDVDIIIDRTGSPLRGFGFGGLYNELCEVFGKSVDMITIDTLEQESTKVRTPWFLENLSREKVAIYERQ